MRAERLVKLLIIFDYDSYRTTGFCCRPRPLNTVLVIDSSNNVYLTVLETAAGSVGQVTRITAELLRFAKELILL